MNGLLQQLLSEKIEGEVRFDLYSKALYSTDASLYQIEPIGVVVTLHKTAMQRTYQNSIEQDDPVHHLGGGTS